MYKNIKAIAPVVTMSLLLVVAVFSVVGFSGWYETFSSNLFVGLETDSGSDNFNSGVESLVDDKLYINAGDGMEVSKIEIDGIDCDISGNYSGISKVDVSTCLSQVTSITPEIVIIANDKIYVESAYIEQETLDNAVPTSTEIVSLVGDILTFQSNYSDLIVTNILIGGNSVVNYPTALNYSLVTTAVNNFDIYSCSNSVSVSSGTLSSGVYNLPSLGFDFPFYDKLIESETYFFVDVKGRISIEDQVSRRTGLSSNKDGDSTPHDNFINKMNIASNWFNSDLNPSGLYICPNQGVSPNKYAIFKFIGTDYYYGSKIDNEIILNESGEIKFHYGGLVNVDWESSIVGLSNGDNLINYEIFKNESDIANITKTQSLKCLMSTPH
jgi:hypothetical protein